MIICLGTTPALQRTMEFAQLDLDAVNRAKSVHEFASGKNINVARVLTTLGTPALATGFLGGDTGELVRRDLEAAAIPHDFSTIGPRTRMCLTLLDRESGEATELVQEPAPVTSEDCTALLAKLNKQLSTASGLVLSGSLAPDVPQDFYRQCTRLAHAVNVPVIVDAKGPSLKSTLAERPRLIKPNRRELEETLETHIDSEEALRESIRRILADGPACAVITMGADGAVASDGRIFYGIKPPAITVQNSIGSGDAFAAGLAAAMSRNLRFEEWCRLGAACAAANAMSAHAGHVDPDVVERLKFQVQIAES